MENERVVSILEEIRDLQRRHLADYREAVENQRESIARQVEGLELYKQALYRVKILVGIIIVVLLALVGVLMSGRL